jgi:hypothetical protein
MRVVSLSLAALVALGNPIAALASTQPADTDQFTPVELACIFQGGSDGGITQVSPDVVGNYIHANLVEVNTIWYRTALGVWNPTRKAPDWVPGTWEHWYFDYVLSGTHDRSFTSYLDGSVIPDNVLTWNLNRPADQNSGQWFITYSELFWTPTVSGAAYSKRVFLSDWIQC